MAPGKVWLVGAGPGAEDLLTLRAAALVRGADVIVHDRLVAPGILTMRRPGARLVDAGKRRACHRMTQAAINALLVRLAGEGLRVVRLKGGDPLVFARGGEEAAALAAAGVPFEVVPGITAATACAAGALIPLTHRDSASGALFLTGHARDGGPDLDWPLLARTHQTLVIYMGLATLPRICAGLVTHGRAASTPVALVENGATPAQRVVTGTLGTIVARAREQAVQAPALVIVGEVVGLRAVLQGAGVISSSAVDSRAAAAA